MKLNDDIKFLILLIVVILSMMCMFFQPKYPVAYDCRIAEFSPDVPPIVKQQCRERTKAWLKQQGSK